MSFRVLLIILLACTTMHSVYAQKKPFRFEIQLNPGINMSQIERTISPDSSEYTRGGIALTGRIIWHPDNELGLGIETGLLRLSTLRIFADNVIPDNSVIQLYAMPILGIAEFNILGADVSGSVGAFNYNVFLGGSGLRATSNEWEIGFGVGIGKAWNIGYNIMLGADARYYRIPERDVTSYAASLRVQYNLQY